MAEEPETLKDYKRRFAIKCALKKHSKGAPSGVYRPKDSFGFTDVTELLADAREIEKYLNEG